VNAPIQWGGETWGAYIWNDVAAKSPRDRKELFLHELFHGIQPQLKLGAAAGTPEHLDSKEGRYWLRLEWKASRRRRFAVPAGSESRLFPMPSHSGTPGDFFSLPVPKTSAGQEITEGLAAYTATVLVADSDSDAIVGALDLLVQC
jgi:hypothetical protein